MNCSTRIENTLFELETVFLDNFDYTKAESFFNFSLENFEGMSFTAIELLSNCENLTRFHLIDRNSNKVVAQAVVAYKKIRLPIGVAKVAFLTHVVVPHVYRNQGMATRLIRLITPHLQNSGTEIVILIARRAVKDFYYKLGYLGFCKFVDFKGVIGENLQACIGSLKPSNYESLIKIRHAFDFTYVRNYKTISRDEIYWLNLLKYKQFEIHNYECRHGFYYVILNKTNGKVIEIAGTSDNYDCILQVIKTNNYILDQITNRHPALSSLRSQPFEFKFRFERKQAHMFKIITFPRTKTGFKLAIELYVQSLSKGLFPKRNIIILPADQV